MPNARAALWMVCGVVLVLVAVHFAARAWGQGHRHPPEHLCSPAPGTTYFDGNFIWCFRPPEGGANVGQRFLVAY